MSAQRYSIDNVPLSITDLVISSIRVVAHTLGPVAPGAQLSQNHWSFYLIHNNGSVRINMVLENPAATSSRGLLAVTSYRYSSVSTSAVRSWDFAATNNLTVYYVLEAIRNKGRSNYDMAENGVGCRYWIFVVMADLVALTYVSPNSFDGAAMKSIIGYNYSINMDPVPLEVKRGTFLDDSQCVSAGTASSSTSYSATTCPQASIELKDSDYVNVTLVKPGGDIASSLYRFHTNLGIVEKRGNQFSRATHPNGSPCMVYYGVNSQRYYWTWELKQGRG